MDLLYIVLFMSYWFDREIEWFVEDVFVIRFEMIFWECRCLYDVVFFEVEYMDLENKSGSMIGIIIFSDLFCVCYIFEVLWV